MGSREMVIEGRALIGEELLELNVAIAVEQGIVRSIEELTSPVIPWIIPALFNAHTHVGDSVAMDIPISGPLEAMVTPPFGLKHRILEQTPEDELIQGMRATIGFMAGTGTAGFADFREGGPQGVRALETASAGLHCRPVILGREGGELVSDGAGISSVRDVPEIESIVRTVRSSGKLLAFHAGERDPGDVDAALSFAPDLLVHCTHATRKQLRQIAEEGIPIAVCARSNWIFGLTESARQPPLQEMVDLDCRIVLGTDNCMTVQPDLWREMSFLSTVYRVPPGLILKAAVSGSQLTGKTYFIREGAPANFMVIDPAGSNLWLSRDLKRTLVTRAGSSNIVKKVISS
jgi:cytosine/adenosine deaminase-related metal-dependent hydrolase